MIEAFRRAFTRLLEYVAILLLGALSVVVILGIIGRSINHPLVWYDELASVLLAWLTYYGAALAALRRAHIGFPGLVNALAPAPRHVVMVSAEALVFGFFALLAYLGWVVFNAIEGDRLVSLPWIPAQLAQSVIPVGAVLFMVAEALSLPAAWRAAAASEPAHGLTSPAKDVLSTE